MTAGPTRRLRLPRSETILRRLNREIRLEQELRRKAVAARLPNAEAGIEQRIRALQSFRASTFGVPLRAYHANLKLFR